MITSARILTTRGAPLAIAILAIASATHGKDLDGWLLPSAGGNIGSSGYIGEMRSASTTEVVIHGPFILAYPNKLYGFRCEISTSTKIHRGDKPLSATTLSTFVGQPTKVLAYGSGDCKEIEVIVQRSPTAQVQFNLTKLHYDPGPVDGQMGTRTISALEQFQRDSGREVTGEVTTDLVDALDSCVWMNRYSSKEYILRDIRTKCGPRR